MASGTSLIVTVTPNPAIDKTIWVEDCRLGRVNRVLRYRLDAGGKGVNISRLLARLGWATAALGFIAGNTGQYLDNLLRGMGIATDFVSVAGETRTNLKIIDPTTGRTTEINDPGPEVLPGEIELLRRKVAEAVSRGPLVVFSGSLPGGCPADLYAEMIAVTKASGGKAVLDAAGEALRLGAQAGPFLVKPNRQELEDLFGTRFRTQREVAAATRELLGLGAEVAVVSLGEQGALAASGRSLWRLIPPKVQVLNTVGAGDALVAVLVASLSGGKSLPEALRYAVAAGSAAVSEPGTGLSSWDRIDALVSEVRVRQIAG